MNDRWSVEARRIREQKAAAQVAQDVATAEQAARRAVERASVEQAHAKMQPAIAEGTVLLTSFLQQHGEAAQDLLAALGDRAYVIFGEDRDGSDSTSVFLYSGGLGTEGAHRGTSGLYSGTQQRPHVCPATPREAVETFAYHGEGRDNPEKVRDITTWLSMKLDTYVK